MVTRFSYNLRVKSVSCMSLTCLHFPAREYRRSFASAKLYCVLLEPSGCGGTENANAGRSKMHGRKRGTGKRGGTKLQDW